MSNERESSHNPAGARLSAPSRGEVGKVAPLILGVDTASERRSLVVLRGADETLAEHVCENVGANLSTALDEVDRALRAASVSVKEIELYAVAVGPGSFTGLRAGLATVKALALTLGKPVVGIQTLEAIAHGAAASGSVLALMPAGRGEVFAQLFRIGDNGAVVEVAPPAHLPPEELIESAQGIEGELTWAGSGAEKHRALIEAAARRAGVDLHVMASAGLARSGGGEGARVWHLSAPTQTLAKSIATLALERLGAGVAMSAESLRAVYVRGADARATGV